MPWKSLLVMDEKIRFVVECLSGEEPMTRLCERYGISRQAGHQLKRRDLAEGPRGLDARPRAPQRRGRATAAARAVRIVDLRRRKPHWGPKTRLAMLAEADPAQAWPAQAWPAHGTVSDVLRREGLNRPGLRARLVAPAGAAGAE
jgi:transposase-like protein